MPEVRERDSLGRITLAGQPFPPKVNIGGSPGYHSFPCLHCLHCSSGHLVLAWVDFQATDQVSVFFVVAFFRFPPDSTHTPHPARLLDLAIEPWS